MTATLLAKLTPSAPLSAGSQEATTATVGLIETFSESEGRRVSSKSPLAASKFPLRLSKRVWTTYVLTQE